MALYREAAELSPPSLRSPDISPGRSRCVPWFGIRSRADPVPLVHCSRIPRCTFGRKPNIQLAVPAFAVHPQIQGLSLLIDFLPVHPVTGPLQDAGELVVRRQSPNLPQSPT